MCVCVCVCVCVCRSVPSRPSQCVGLAGTIPAQTVRRGWSHPSSR